MLAPYYLKERIPWDDCFPFGADFYHRYDVTCHFGAAVEKLDAVGKEVSLSGGDHLSFDRCLIATGASPVVPPVPGLVDSSLTLTLRTAKDTRRLEQVIPDTKKAVVLGASLVGIKVAEILRTRGIEVILVDVADQMLPHSAHPEAASYMRDYYLRKGIDVRLGCTLGGFEDEQDGAVCHFPDRTTERADVCVVCTGIRPNLNFIDPDEAGDVSQGKNRLTGASDWLGLWGNACYQGRTAGLNMAGIHENNPGGISEHISPLFDWTFAQIGDVHRRDEKVRIVSCGNPFEGLYQLLVFDQGILIGVNLINGFRHLGNYKTAILRRLDWSTHLERLDYSKNEEIEKILVKLIY